tara:strand:- start:2689 stop:2970 length:282 start_codon:yes stop_codon:yes gene_type:complete
MNESNFWTKRTTSESTFNIGANDGLTSISVIVSGSGSDTTDITGTLTIDGVVSGVISIAVGESITISADAGKVINGITIVTASDNTTDLIAVQ